MTLDEHEQRVNRFKILQQDLIDGLEKAGPDNREAYLADREHDFMELTELRHALQEDLQSMARNGEFTLRVEAAKVVVTTFTPSETDEICERQVQAIARAGERLQRIAKLFMSKEAFDLYVAPPIADIQHEYVEALRNGRPWLARWYVLRGVIWLLRPWAWGAVVAKLITWWGRIS